MKKSTFCRLCAALLCTALSLHFSISMAQGARMLPKGGSELNAGFSGFISTEGFGGAINALGAGFGFGASDKVNLKFRYARLFSEEFDNGINLVSFAPKFALVQNKVSATLPLSVLFADGESIWAISPGFQFSAGKSSKAEFTGGVRGDIPFSDEIDGVLLSLTVGGGFSSNLDRWAIRPEAGLLFSTAGGSPVLTLGIGANAVL